MRASRPTVVRRGQGILAASALLLLGACADSGMLGTPTVPTPVLPPADIQAVTCSASVQSGSLSCAPTAPSAGGASAVLVGGQNQNVKLTSSAVSYSALDSIFRFDVTVQNLLPEAIGTADGQNVHPDGVRVFFYAQPRVTGGAGGIEVWNADSEGTFTAAGQPYFQYDGILRTNEISPTRTWEIKVDPGVSSFDFVVYLATPTQPLLVINEVMANPGGAVQDSVGEYVELYNAGRFPVNLRGMTVSDNGGSFTILDSVTVRGGGYALLGRSRNTSKNGGILPDVVYSPNSTATTLQLSNSGSDYFRIRSASGLTLDSVGYANASTAAAAGVARELINPSLDNTSVDGGNWRAATNEYFAGNRGTPGSGNGAGEPLPEAGPPVTVVVSPGTAVVSAGSGQQFSAVARDSLSQVTSTTFTWTSLDSIASVSSTGFATIRSVGTARIVARAANGVADTATITATAVAGVDYRNHLEFGIPMDADSSNDIVLVKRQFALSYGPNRGGPNWVAWNLNATHFGGEDRCDCFKPDPQLPAGVYRVVTGDYSGSGYSRGHMVMSAQRTANEADNEATFLMTNILPQLQDMNGGPWLAFENHNNSLARSSNKELYIYAGGIYSASPATLGGQGRVQIPVSTWKIVVVMNRGQGLANVTSASDIQVYAVNMPNQSGIQGTPWTSYRTTVDAIEAATGYDFLSALPDGIEAAVEAQLSL